MSKPSDIKLAVAGLCYWGKNILRNAYETGLLHAACDANLHIIEERKKRFPDIRYTKDFNDIINSPQINAVLISTPASTYFNMVKDALNAIFWVFIGLSIAVYRLKNDKS